MKTVVLDSSSLISLSESCAVSLIRHLKEKGAARFAAPAAVFKESVERPLGIKKYSFSAVRIKKLFSDGTVGKISVKEEKTNEVLSKANNLFFVSGKPLELIQLGEAECVAAMSGLEEKVVVVDEKTLRLLIEDPEKLRDVLKKEYEDKITINEETLVKWRGLTRGIKILRSAELMAAAAKEGYFSGFGQDENVAFHSAIYALKGCGCSLTNQELLEFESIFVGR